MACGDQCDDDRIVIYRGQELPIDFVEYDDSDALVNISTLPVTLILSSPQDENPVTQFVFRYLNGGTSISGVTVSLEDGGFRIRFYATAAWTAANLYPGIWMATFTKDLAATTQEFIGAVPIQVLDTPTGPLPIVGGP